ncbi:MAG: sulfatase-like hydrolase/transferase [Flavobacteriales bacterium]
MFRGPLLVLLLRLLSVAVVYTALRILFHALNSAAFPDVPVVAFLGGVRFDLSAIAWLHLPWVVLYLVNPDPGGVLGRIQFLVFISINAVALFFNCVDLEYFKFSMKRSTADFIRILGAGGDTVNLLPAFLKDYWYILLIYLGCLTAIAWSYVRIGRLGTVERSGILRKAAWRILAIILLVIASRGGMQLIPLQPLDGVKYGGATYLPVVLNTPFTIMTSLGKPVLEERVYMDQRKADELWPVVHDHDTPIYQPAQAWDLRMIEFADRPLGSDMEMVKTGPPNVVVIILESFSAVYSGRLAGGDGYMPFLDSLMGEGLNMTHAYANGRRSIDGIPAILGSIPELMDEAFITSPYASIPFTSLANTLAAEGYRTSFYHGGRNGTMGFDAFARSAGFHGYFGLNEYTGPDSDNDGHWGVRDRPYLQYFAAQLAREQEPFMSTVFTLSSHHPYELPPADAERFGGGTLPIHPTLRYADDALRHFFLTARTMPWYANTLFVITADHTADIERDGRHSDKAIDYWVPLVYYMPQRIAPTEQDRVTQHIDILPTILELADHTGPFFSFGHSALRPGPPYAVHNNNGVYNIIGASMHLQFDGEQVLGVRALGPTGTVDSSLARDMELRLKAAIQQFNGHLLSGDLTSSEQ